jgi:hypothetical protein
MPCKHRRKEFLCLRMSTLNNSMVCFAIHCHSGPWFSSKQWQVLRFCTQCHFCPCVFPLRHISGLNKHHVEQCRWPCSSNPKRNKSVECTQWHFDHWRNFTNTCSEPDVICVQLHCIVLNIMSKDIHLASTGKKHRSSFLECFRQGQNYFKLFWRERVQQKAVPVGPAAHQPPTQKLLFDDDNVPSCV